MRVSYANPNEYKQYLEHVQAMQRVFEENPHRADLIYFFRFFRGLLLKTLNSSLRYVYL